MIQTTPLDLGTFDYDALVKLFVSLAAGLMLSGFIWVCLIIRARNDAARDEAMRSMQQERHDQR